MAFARRACSLLLLSYCCVLGAALGVSPGRAQDSEGVSPDAPGTATGGSKDGPEMPAPAGKLMLSDEQALEEEQAPQDTYRDSTHPHEEPGKSYFFAGAAWRYVRLPSWTLEWFLESAPSVGTAGSFLGEFGYRKDGFQVTATAGYMGWSFHGPFQLAGDPEVDTEWLDGDFNFLMATAAVTWSTAFTDWFALEYGFEAGLAALVGTLTRTEAFRDGNGTWGRCPGWAGGPDLTNPTPQQAVFCDRPIGRSGELLPNDVRSNGADDLGAHYGVKASRVPPVVPILGPRLSLRFKPIAQLVLRVDVPLPLAPFGFMGGLAAHYGF